jgi:TetR/AcrR family transcriptional regulator
VPSRRSPVAEVRKRDSERTRAALLEAATAEFAAKGREGARVSEIAARAGVNKQLVSYYFGGKDGLYRAILDRWADDEAQLTEPDLPLVDLATRYLEAGAAQPDLQRLFLRECLVQDVTDVVHQPDAPELEQLRASRQRGEIAAELDPAFVLLALQSIVVSAVQFPGDVKRLTGLDPCSPEHLAWAREQLRRLVGRLGDDAPPTGETS